MLYTLLFTTKNCAANIKKSKVVIFYQSLTLFTGDESGSACYTFECTELTIFAPQIRKQFPVWYSAA